jgi:hypothetical protein
MRGTDIIRGNSQPTPVPRRDISREHAGAGPVISRVLTPEELQAVIRQYGKPLKRLPVRDSKRPNAPGEGLNKPQRRENSGRKPIPEPDRRTILQRIAVGETIRGIEKSMGVSKGRLSTWIKKWKLIGITPDQARAILAQEVPHGS